MKQDGNDKITFEGEIKTTFETQNQSLNNNKTPKSGGNTPSDLGAINSNLPGGVSNPDSRSTLNRPSLDGLTRGQNSKSNNSAPRSSNGGQRRQTNNGQRRSTQQSSTQSKKTVSKQGERKQSLGEKLNDKRKQRIQDPKDLNPQLNKNQMKDFGKKKKVKDPKPNSSASFFEKGKGLFSGKGKVPGNLASSATNTIGKKAAKTGAKKVVKKSSSQGLIAMFKALPIQAKLMILGAGVGVIMLIFVVIIIVIISDTSASDGNREMKRDYIDGDYTEEQLCKYLIQNDYIQVSEDVKCEDTPAYQFFTNFKEVVNEYKEKYSRYRFSANTELLYETMAYYKSDEELYNAVTKEEITKLVDAMLEEIEESCVQKTYDKKKKVCTRTKYVYTLYEFSLNKYISYLKYGDTSTHPNYGHDLENESSNGKSVVRKCGEGKNVDYIFGYGLVNTSSSPLSEFSECPGEEVTEEDYKKGAKNINVKKTSLEELDAFGGVTSYERSYLQKEADLSNEKIKVDIPSADTAKNVYISPSHQPENMYSGFTNLSEKDSMEKLASALGSILQSRGYNVNICYMDGCVTERKASLYGKNGAKWFESVGANGVYIALHSNATGTGGIANGPVAFYLGSNANSKKFTQLVCNHIEGLYKANGRKTRTCFRDNGNLGEIQGFYSNSNSSNSGATLVEVGFHDNVEEASWIVNNYDSIAKALADAIDEYVG